MKNFNFSLARCRIFLVIVSLMCTWQVQAQEREVTCVYKEEYCASTNRGTSKMLAPARGQPVINTKMQFGKAELDVSRLKEGQYKVIVYTSKEPIFGTINISR
jgi:hypothetical protein